MEPTRVNLAGWLIDRGYAEVERGYGHVSGEDLADALMDAGWITDREV